MKIDLLKNSDEQFLVGLDFDGVVINSIQTMKLAWDQVIQEFNIKNKNSFSEYSNNIGKPFPVIMELLGLESHMPEIMDFYFKQTNFYSKHISLYKGIKEVIDYINSVKRLRLVLITSKCKYRTLEIIDLFNLEFDLVITPEATTRGKPFPEPLFYANQKLKISATNSLYVGDMISDYQAANAAAWKYLHASWGYGKKQNLSNCELINSPYDIIKQLKLILNI